jgi:methyl-accepting chemotaxis protein
MSQNYSPLLQKSYVVRNLLYVARDSVYLSPSMKLDFTDKLNKYLSDALLGVRRIYSGVKSQSVFREIYRSSGKRNDLKILNQGAHIFFSNQKATSKSLASGRWRKASSALRNHRCLGATVQNVVATVQNVVARLRTVVATVQTVDATVENVVATVKKNVVATAQTLVATVQNIAATVKNVDATEQNVVATVQNVATVKV